MISTSYHDHLVRPITDSRKKCYIWNLILGVKGKDENILDPGNYLQ